MPGKVFHQLCVDICETLIMNFPMMMLKFSVGKKNWFNRGVKEAIFIKMLNPSLNKQGGGRFMLSAVWDCNIRQISRDHSGKQQNPRQNFHTITPRWRRRDVSEDLRSFKKVSSVWFNLFINMTFLDGSTTSFLNKSWGIQLLYRALKNLDLLSI